MEYRCKNCGWGLSKEPDQTEWSHIWTLQDYLAGDSCDNPQPDEVDLISDILSKYE